MSLRMHILGEYYVRYRLLSTEKMVKLDSFTT